MKIYVVHDVQANVFGTPQFMLTDGIALRTVSDLIKDPASILAKHPEDFSLYMIGEYDEASGTIKAMDRPSLVIRVNSLVTDKTA